jgi:hypothetical protein
MASNRTVTVGPNQSIADIAIQEYGTLEALTAFCRHNDIQPALEPVVGDEYEVPETDENRVAIPTDKAVLKYMAENGVTIGTLNIEIPPLSYRIVLSPDMEASVPNSTPAGSLGSWKMDVVFTDDFIHLNPLEEWTGSNNMEVQTKAQWEADDPSDSTPGGNPIGDGIVSYAVTSAPYPDGSLFCFMAPHTSTDGDEPTFDAIATFKVTDDQDNVAHLSPVVVVSQKSDPQEVVAFILPEYTLSSPTLVPGGRRFGLIVSQLRNIFDVLHWEFQGLQVEVDGVIIEPHSSGEGINPEEEPIYYGNYSFVLTPGIHKIRIITEMLVDAPTGWAFRDIIVEVGNF